MRLLICQFFSIPCISLLGSIGQGVDSLADSPVMHSNYILQGFRSNLEPRTFKPCTFRSRARAPPGPRLHDSSLVQSRMSTCLRVLHGSNVQIARATRDHARWHIGWAAWTSAVEPSRTSLSQTPPHAAES